MIYNTCPVGNWIRDYLVQDDLQIQIEAVDIFFIIFGAHENNQFTMKAKILHPSPHLNYVGLYLNQCHLDEFFLETKHHVLNMD